MKVEMRGLAELTAKLRTVSAELQDRPIKAGLRAAGKVVKDVIVLSAPYDGVTPDNIHIRDNVVVGRSRSRSGPGREVFTVGIKLGQQVLSNTARNRRLGIVGKKVKTEGDAWYWKLIEFGSSHQPAQPFIRPAAAAATAAALAAFEKKAKQSADRIIKKHSK